MVVNFKILPSHQNFEGDDRCGGAAVETCPGDGFVMHRPIRSVSGAMVTLWHQTLQRAMQCHNSSCARPISRKIIFDSSGASVYVDMALADKLCRPETNATEKM